MVTSLILAGLEIVEVPGLKLGSSFGLSFLSTVFMFAIVPVIFFDHYKINSKGKVSKKSTNEANLAPSFVFRNTGYDDACGEITI